MILAQPNSLSFLSAGGEMGRMIRAKDWSLTPLGPPEFWPGSLRTLVQVMLISQQPMFIAWGEQRTMLYNDGYVPMCAERHPSALGMPFAQVWADIMPAIGPIMDAAFAGVPTYMDDIEFMLVRDGRKVETHFSFGYTPVHDEHDQVAGMFCTALEITSKVKQGKLSDAELTRIRSMLEQAPSFMAVLAGPQHVFEITNAAYLQLTGHRDLIGRSVREALPEIAGQGFYELLDEVYTTGKPFIGHALPAVIQRLPNAAPEERFIDMIYQPFSDEAGQVAGIFVQGHDITDQKQAELAAATSEARFRNLAQSIPNHVWTALPDGNLNWFNDQVYDYTGALPGDLDGHRWGQIVHSEDLALAASAWSESVANLSPYNAEFRLRRSDGIYRWHIARGTAVFDGDGELAYWVGTNTDIEDQKAAELALLESQLEVKLALAAAETGVWELKRSGNVNYEFAGDERALALSGMNNGSQSFKSVLAHIHPADRRALLAAAKSAILLNGERLMDVEYRVLHDDQSLAHWVHARAQAMPDVDRTRLVGTVRDITDRKDAEARQEMLQGELQHRIKNMFALVSAIASQTLKGDDIAARAAMFTARIQSLSHAHELLMSNSWVAAPIGTVVNTALAAHGSDRTQFAVHGTDLELSAKQALSLALAVHELATNATKYGALSVKDGRVHISWSEAMEEGSESCRFQFVWHETGGPAVAEPTKKGFGSRLITRVLASDFAGAVTIQYLPDGLICQLNAPALSVTAR